MAHAMSPAEAATELLRRRRAREHFQDFCRYVKPDYIEGEHLVQLCDTLEKVESGEIRRLMVFMPPRHSKSMHVSQMFPCWLLGRNPTLEVVQCGHTHNLTLEHSRRARDFFTSDPMHRIFPGVHHRPERESQRMVAIERQAAHEWGTVQGGVYYAVGVQGALTGRGADVAIIDDPVKDRAEAESETIRAKVWDWYKGVLYTRLSPAGAVILVMTRWHPEDLAGKLLTEMAAGGDQWTVFEMPALVDDDTPLWPERYDLDKLQSIRAAVGAHEWASQYQQEPYVRGGNMFHVEHVRVHDKVEEFPATTYVRFWDLASTVKERTKDDPDFTAGALVGVTYDGPVPSLWIKDLALCQQEAPERDRRILTTATNDGASVRIGIESVAGYKDAHSTISAILKGQRMVEKIGVVGDKVVRAAPLEPIFEAGNVHILKAPWNDQFINQFTQFPAGAHDDIVDAVSGGYNMIATRNLTPVNRNLLGA